MSACVEWEGALSGGYGVRRVRGVRWYVHRLAWTEEHGPIPDGMVVRHRCDNPRCYNVEHLQLGTQSDNTQDMHERGRYVNGMATRDRCKNNHEYTPESTYWWRGMRLCRTCRAGSMRKMRRNQAHV